MDKINALFELGGFLAVVASIISARKAGTVVGVSWLTPCFFSAWGYWNLLFYPMLDQAWSAAAALLLAAANSYWLWLIWMYRQER